MPGAEIKEVVSENQWKATMHVKLGPISLQFDTDVERVEADVAARRVVLSAKARELRGRGGAAARIESTLSDAETGTRVEIQTDLNLQGMVAQYGRGVVADVSSQLTSQFAGCLASQLTAAPERSSEDAAEGADDMAAAAPPPKPIGGLSLAFRALWRQLTSVFRRRG